MFAPKLGWMGDDVADLVYEGSAKDAAKRTPSVAQLRATSSGTRKQTLIITPLEQFDLNSLLDLKSARERILISKARISRKQCIRKYPYGSQHEPTTNGGPSLQNLDLGIKRGRNLERRNACALEVRVEEGLQAIRRNGKLPTSVDSDHAYRAHRPHHDIAL